MVLNRSWESAVTPSLLQQTPSAPKPPVGIFLDPPYLTHDRDATLYQGDAQADDVARKALAWAIEHGDTLSHRLRMRRRALRGARRLGVSVAELRRDS